MVNKALQMWRAMKTELGTCLAVAQAAARMPAFQWLDSPTSINCDTITAARHDLMQAVNAGTSAADQAALRSQMWRLLATEPPPVTTPPAELADLAVSVTPQLASIVFGLVGSRAGHHRVSLESAEFAVLLAVIAPESMGGISTAIIRALTASLAAQADADVVVGLACCLNMLVSRSPAERHQTRVLET
jgi:hypothetical protein